MNWEKDKFTVIKKAISPEIAEFLKNYILLKRKVTQTFLTTKYIIMTGVYGLINKFPVLILIMEMLLWKHY